MKPRIRHVFFVTLSVLLLGGGYYIWQGQKNIEQSLEQISLNQVVQKTDGFKNTYSNGGYPTDQEIKEKFWKGFTGGITGSFIKQNDVDTTFTYATGTHGDITCDIYYTGRPHTTENPVICIDHKNYILYVINATDKNCKDQGILVSPTSHAYDVATMADIQQIQTALNIYRADHNTFPNFTNVVDTSLLKEYLQGSYLNIMPSDKTPNVWQHFNGQMSTGYIYISPLKSNSKADGMMLLGKVSNVENANRIDADPSITEIKDMTKLNRDKLKSLICKQITINDTTIDSLQKCTAKKGSDKLRYVYISD